MISRSKLLSTVSSVSGTWRHIGDLPETTKPLHMWKLPMNQLLRGNLRSCASVPGASYFTYINDTNSTITKRDKKSGGKVMEPIIDLRIPQNEPTNCQMPSNIVENVMIDGNSLSSNHQYGMSKKRYKELRPWENVNNGLSTVNETTDFVLRLVSYNILAQSLLETHSYLYRYHNQNCLGWAGRKSLIQQEILGANANVICIQEMQAADLQDFLVPFQQNGFDYLYKKRTNDRKDGLLLLYQRSQLKLVNCVNVEYRQTSENILDRDNVGIVAKFALRSNPETHVVISTTHLLYNPGRNDVRLAQVQVLFAELERIAFIENSREGPKYHPIILCGDFNLPPHTGVYRFIVDGSFQYYGKSRKLEEEGNGRLNNCLLSSSLLITDNCQHFNVLSKRIRGFGQETTMLDNSEKHSSADSDRKSLRCLPSSEVNTRSSDFQRIEIVQGQFATFCSGALTHPFKLKSVYNHRKRKGQQEATTYHGKWISADYIFCSDVELVQRYRVPTISECEQLPSIPNFAAGSDHLCIGATFKVKKKTTVK